MQCLKLRAPEPYRVTTPRSYFSYCLLRGILTAPSNAEIGVKLVHVGLQFRVGKAVDDLAVLDDVVAVSHRGGEAEILFDQQDGKAFRFQPRDGVADLLDDDRSQSLGR